MREKLIKSGEKLVKMVKRVHNRIQEHYQKSSKAIDILEQDLANTPDDDTERTMTRDHWAFWIIGLVCIAIGFVVFKLVMLIYLILTAFILAMAIESIIGFFQKWCSRGLSIGLSYFLVIVFLLSVVIVVIPFIVSQTIELSSVILDQIVSWQSMVQNKGLESVVMDTNLPGQIKEIVNSLILGDDIGGAVQTVLMSNIDQLVSFGSSTIKDAGGVVVTMLTGFFAVAVQIALVFVLSIFFSIEKKKVIHLLAKATGHVERTELVLMKLYRKLGLRLKGQAVLCLTIFIMVGIGLNILSWIGFDLPNKMTLALIAGMLEFIPYLGPFLGMLPALLIGLSQFGFYGFLAVLILYILIQQSENNILVPIVMSHTLGTSPLLILICLILGGSLFGFLGILLAVPIAVIISILYDTYSKNK